MSLTVPRKRSLGNLAGIGQWVDEQDIQARTRSDDAEMTASTNVPRYDVQYLLHDLEEALSDKEKGGK